MLKARLYYGVLLTAVVLAVLFVDARWFAPVYPLFAIGILALVVMGSTELCHLLQQLPAHVELWYCRLGAVAIVLACWLPLALPAPKAPDTYYPLMTFVVMAVFSFLLVAVRYQGPGRSIAAITGYLLVFFYMGVLASFVVLVRWYGDTPSDGVLAFLLTVFTAKCCDIGAYAFGRRFGRHKMAPILSPNKTWEGAAGGVFLANVLAFALVYLGKWATGTRFLSDAQTLVFAVVVGVTAMVGDLMESLLKRDSGLKDASNRVPGFGGFLDIIDSVLFAGPVAYLLLFLLGDG